MHFDLAPVGDSGVILRFGDSIGEEAEGLVLAADRAVQRARFSGVIETVPSYTALYVAYDPMVTDARSLADCLQAMDIKVEALAETQEWTVPVCYDEAFSPDLDALCESVGMEREALIECHLSGEYRVSMYGFAPGYAYMRGVPTPMQAPRKKRPVNDVPAGSVIVAGPQCIVTTLPYPTGWWRIGYSSFEFLQRDEDNQFPVAVGSRVRFERVAADELPSPDNRSRE